MSASPVLSAGGDAGRVAEFDLYSSDFVVTEFDLQTVLNRTGYPPLQFKSQAWRSQAHLAFPAEPEVDDQGIERTKYHVRGGKIYIAATGGSNGNS